MDSPPRTFVGRGVVSIQREDGHYALIRPEGSNHLQPISSLLSLGRRERKALERLGATWREDQSRGHWFFELNDDNLGPVAELFEGWAQKHYKQAVAAEILATALGVPDYGSHLLQASQLGGIQRDGEYSDGLVCRAVMYAKATPRAHELLRQHPRVEWVRPQEMPARGMSRSTAEMVRWPRS